MKMKMIVKITMSVALSVAAGHLAFAQSTADKSLPTGKTRAEVVAEVMQSGGDLARKNYEATFNPPHVRPEEKPSRLATQ